MDKNTIYFFSVTYFHILSYAVWIAWENKCSLLPHGGFTAHTQINSREKYFYLIESCAKANNAHTYCQQKWIDICSTGRYEWVHMTSLKYQQ